MLSVQRKPPSPPVLAGAAAPRGSRVAARLCPQPPCSVAAWFAGVSGCDKCVSRVLISLWVSHGVERHLGVLREGPRPGPARAFQPPGLSLGLASAGSSLGSLAEQPPSPCQRESPRGGGWDGRSITEVCARMHGVGAQAFPTDAVNQGFIDFSRLLFNYR